MIVKTYYEGGRVVAFDTDHMTEGLPQRGNLLTNYAIDLDNMEGGGLWLSTYYYEAAEQYRGTVGPKGLPVARRRDGWSFLLADEEDVKTLLRVTLDDETVLIRIASEIVNVAALHWAFDVADDIAPMAIVAHDHLAVLLCQRDSADVELEACRMMGFTHKAYRIVTQTVSEDKSCEAPRGTRNLF